MKTDKIRLYWADNTKALLIYLVVLGHIPGAVFTNIGYLPKDSYFFQIIYWFIYFIHMPLFSYLAGVFSQSLLRGQGLKRVKDAFGARSKRTFVQKGGGNSTYYNVSCFVCCYLFNKLCYS